MTTPSDRRAHTRRSMSFPVLLSSEQGQTAVGLVQNASCGGLLVATARRLPVGEAVHVRFRSDDAGGYTSVSGVVVRRVAPQMGHWAPELVAVRFGQTPPDLPGILERAKVLAGVCQNAAELTK